MNVSCVWEHNGDDTLLYVVDFPGAYTRSHSKETALAKMEQEVRSFMKWSGEACPQALTVQIVQDVPSALEIRDADSDVLFEAEELPLTYEEYLHLKALALKSAEDFLSLYQSIPDKNARCMPVRKTFYGNVPGTAEEMYQHTKNVNSYYFGEINVEVDSEGTILQCRERGFEALEKQRDFLNNAVIEGSYGELWSVRKVLRRFIWHDRIHAKAMYRLAARLGIAVPDLYFFENIL